VLLITGNSFGAALPPRYENYKPQTRVGWDAAEPSIGINWRSGNVLFQAGLETIRVSFNNATSPAVTSWVNTENLLLSLISLDPILFTDNRTNRTYVSQLVGGCSITSFSDDDGGKWTSSQGCGIPAGLDHQTVGGGAYVSRWTIIKPLTSYPNTVYYCSQNLVSAFCSRSDTGGLTFGPGVPIYSLAQCDGLHGHVKIAPDGTTYVPNSSCGGKQGVAVSENNRLTWTIRTIPGSTSGLTDPSLGIGSASTIYFGYINGKGRPYLAVSKDRGRSWINHMDVGKSVGIQNAVFPAVIAGDDNRAAFAFLGTTTPGNFQDPSFNGRWYLYIAFTFDSGKTWNVSNATPNDPVQAGSINVAEGLQPSGRRFTTGMSTPLVDRGDRNLLDFINAAVDKQGRIHVAYADGCINDCVANPSANLSRSAMATIARQSGGKRLFAAYDPVEPARPAAPLLQGTRTASAVSLSWSQPDNGGSNINSYRIYRGRTSGGETFLKTVTGTSYKDTSVIKGITYYYRVTAVNSIGEGLYSNELVFP
jgi:hypothetical protein